MAYDENLANRIREYLADLPNVEEKKMMGGLAFMVNDKLCVGIFKDELMCRIDPEIRDSLLEKTGCRQMDFTGKQMKGYVLVDDSVLRTQMEFAYWIDLCLGFNGKARSSKKKKKD